MVAPSIGIDTTRAQRLTFQCDGVVSRQREGGHTCYCPLVNMQASKKEQRGLIRFLAVEGVEGREMHRRKKVVTILDRVLGAREAGVYYRLFSVWTLVPVRPGKQLFDNSTVDEITSEAADCRLTYTMPNCPQRRKDQIEAREIHHGKRLSDACRVFEHHTGDNTIWLVSTPNLRDDTCGWSGDSYLSSPFTNLTRGPPARRLFRRPHAGKALYIYKHPYLLRDSNQGPMAQQLRSLTTVPDGRGLTGNTWRNGALPPDRRLKQYSSLGMAWDYRTIC
ncbi:hypothetical protein TNCV_1182271 [Trichonephila clavipes]|nr:hypothetical protein TNCV_1182271 [Trichonephila clavipes]